MAVYKNVVIIGNGPSAITLSFMLAGNWPYYNAASHNVEFLHYRLDENRTKSLIEQDLVTLSEGLEGRSSNPVALLFDNLNHPEADLGTETESALLWQNNSNKEIDHVVIGKGHPGGSWQQMEAGILTISFGSWMELPDVTLREWDILKNREQLGHSRLRQNRATVSSIAKYYRDYVEIKNLNKYFMNSAVVTKVQKLKNAFPDFNTFVNMAKTKELWLVKGFVRSKCSDTGEAKKERFCFVTPNVVLCTGCSNLPNHLNITGENFPFVLHSLHELEDLIFTKELNPLSDPLLIVGAGLSAADAVIAAHFHGIPTLHIFRRDVDDPDLIFNKLPTNLYPEYHKVHQMMRDSSLGCYDGYKSLQGYVVSEIRPDRSVVLVPVGQQNNVCKVVRVSYVVVLIGMRPDLSFLPQKGTNLGINEGYSINSRNPIDIDLFTHESLKEPGLYAMGPLIGDNFVRFIQGGALAIMSHLNQKLLTK